MTLLSAYEDFVGRTLGAFRSAWEKLRYISSLREGSRRYRHWGMEKTYGDGDAEQAIQRAHTEVALSVLRRPIRQLSLELEEADAACVQQVAEETAAFSPEA